MLEYGRIPLTKKMIKNYLQAGSRLFYKGNLMPLYLIHFVTSKCNAKCSHCFYWKNLNKEEKTLIPEEIDKTTKTMGNLLFIGLTGGEPFLRKDLVDIVKIYYKNTKPLTISIPTNGILTKKILSDTEQMLKDCPKTNISIRFSLDGTEKIHDNIRGKKGIFKLMMRSYKSLNKLKNKYKNLNIGFVTVISTANQNNLDELFNFTKDKLNDNLWFILLARGDVKDKQLKKVDVKLYNDFTKRVSFLLNKKSSFLSNLLDTKDQLTYELVAKTTIENKYQIPCYAGKTSCIITENGEINPCETLDYTFGNIRDFDYNFKKLWNTKKAKTFRKNIGKCFCSHECWIANNILFNFKTWPKILKSMRK